MVFRVSHRVCDHRIGISLLIDHITGISLLIEECRRISADTGCADSDGMDGDRYRWIEITVACEDSPPQRRY